MAWGACMLRAHAWLRGCGCLGAYMAGGCACLGGLCGQGACVPGGPVWLGGMCAWGGLCGQGACVPGGMCATHPPGLILRDTVGQ